MEIWAQNSATRRPAFSFCSEREPFPKDGPGHLGCRPSLSPAWRISPGCPWIDNFRGFGIRFENIFFCCSCMDYSFRLLFAFVSMCRSRQAQFFLQVYRNSLYNRNWHLFRHSFNILPTSAIFSLWNTAYPFVSFSFKILPTCVIFSFKILPTSAIVSLLKYCLPAWFFSFNILPTSVIVSLLKYCLPAWFFRPRGRDFDSYARIVDSTNARKKQPRGRKNHAGRQYFRRETIAEVGCNLKEKSRR